MFNKKEQNELFIPKNKIMTILNCNFIIKKNNTYQTFEEYKTDNDEGQKQIIVFLL